MSRTGRFARVAVSAGLLVTALTASGAAASASNVDGVGQRAATLAVPSNLVPPAGHQLVGDFGAKGVQVYRCTAGAWTFVEPAANLIGVSKPSRGLLTVIHFRGPSWESTDDGSLVEAKVVASSPVPGSIPELLLQSSLNRGNGFFGKVSFVQRLATSGGLAPTRACADGETEGVKYRAQYRFFAPIPR